LLFLLLLDWSPLSPSLIDWWVFGFRFWNLFAFLFLKNLTTIFSLSLCRMPHTCVRKMALFFTVRM
jgi:hypothetical protein